MIEARKTEIFAKWLDGFRDIRARARIQARIERLATGNPGDTKAVGEGVSEVADSLWTRLSGLLQKAQARAGDSIGRWRQKHPSQ